MSSPDIVTVQSRLLRHSALLVHFNSFSTKITFFIQNLKLVLNINIQGVDHWLGVYHTVSSLMVKVSAYGIYDGQSKCIWNLRASIVGHRG